jgi:hypothetical protein
MGERALLMVHTTPGLYFTSKTEGDTARLSFDF